MKVVDVRGVRCHENEPGQKIFQNHRWSPSSWAKWDKLDSGISGCNTDRRWDTNRVLLF